MLTLTIFFAILSLSLYTAMIICAVSAHRFGNERLGAITRMLCWLVGIINLPAVFVGGLGLIIIAACYASYRVSGRKRHKFRTPSEKAHPDFDSILDAGID